MSEQAEPLTEELRKGLRCLRLEAPESVCADIERLAFAAIDATAVERDRLREIIDSASPRDKALREWAMVENAAQVRNHNRAVDAEATIDALRAEVKELRSAKWDGR